MKILHVISNLEIGGAQRVRLELVRRLIAAGDESQNHKVLYFCDGPMRKKFENLGIKTEYISFSGFNFFTAWSKFAAVINAFQPTIIHSELWLANFVSRIFARLKKIPVICDLHSMSEINGYFKNLIDKITPLKANAFVAVSEAVATDFKAKFGINAVVIKNGVDAHKFRFSFAAREELREELNIPNNSFVIGAVGRLDAIKNFDNLIYAYASLLGNMRQTNHPLALQTFLVIVGDGKLRQKLQLLATELGIAKNLIFASATKSMYRYYSIFDCLAISSRSEGLSVAMLEALFSGLQVICTAPAAQHDIITCGKNGFLVPFAEHQAMAESILKIIDRFNAEFCARPALIDARFDVSKMVVAYKQLYADVLRKFNQNKTA